MYLFVGMYVSLSVGRPVCVSVCLFVCRAGGFKCLVWSTGCHFLPSVEHTSILVQQRPKSALFIFWKMLPVYVDREFGSARITSHKSPDPFQIKSFILCTRKFSGRGLASKRVSTGWFFTTATTLILGCDSCPAKISPNFFWHFDIHELAMYVQERKKGRMWLFIRWAWLNIFTSSNSSKSAQCSRISPNLWNHFACIWSD